MRIALALFVLALAGCAASTASPWYACYPRLDRDGDPFALCAPIDAASIPTRPTAAR